MNRPFWMHQVIEYVLGIGLVSLGIQSTSPAVPALFGVLVVINASAVAGPLSAFRAVPRRLHRVADFALAAAMIASVVVFRRSMESSTQLAVAGVGALMAFVSWRTNFAEKPKGSASRATRAAARGSGSETAEATNDGGRSDEIGRKVGRAAAVGVRMYRNRRGG